MMISVRVTDAMENAWDVILLNAVFMATHQLQKKDARF